MRLVLGCEWRLSMACIQIENIDFLPPGARRRLWRGWKLGVTVCWNQLIYFLDLNFLSSSSHYPILLLFLTCVYWIHCIIIYWSWNLSLDVIGNFLRAVSKLDIWICFTHRIVEGCGKGTGWVKLIFDINLFLCLI